MFMRSFFIYLCSVVVITVLSLCLIFVNNYFYPIRYRKEIVETSTQTKVESGMLASVINVESHYNPKAISNKGAVGLMQIVPSTAKWICDINGLSYSDEMLQNPGDNIKIGGLYLSYLSSIFEDKRVVICAYNAGQGNVSSWLKNKEYSFDGKTLSKIPFRETENYVKMVFKNYQYYKKRFN